MRIWLLGALFLFLLRLIGDYVPLTDATGWLWITRLSEVWVVLGVLSWAVAPYLRGTVIEEIGRGRTLVIGGLVLGLMIGQYLEVEAYPFVKWDMYSTPSAGLSFVELQMIEVGEEAGHLPLVGSTTVTKEPRALLTAIGELAHQAAGGEEAARRDLEQALTAFAVGSGQSIDAVEVRECIVARDGIAAPPSCVVISTVDLRVTG